MIDKQTLLLAAGVGIGAFALTELVLTLKERKEKPVAEREEQVLAAVEKIRNSYSYPEETVVEEREVVVPDEKPELVAYFNRVEQEEPAPVVHENIFDKPEPEEEGEPVGTSTEEYLARIGKTKWNTVAVKFDENGVPSFTDEEWDSEVNNIELISQEEYEDEDIWPLYDRDQAIWYPKDGVLADQEFNLLDVVDCVGPNAFCMMVKSHGGIVYVKNDELEKCYEIWENDVDFEEALEDSGFADNVHIRLE